MKFPISIIKPNNTCIVSPSDVYFRNLKQQRQGNFMGLILHNISVVSRNLERRQNRKSDMMELFMAQCVRATDASDVIQNHFKYLRKVENDTEANYEFSTERPLPHSQKAFQSLCNSS